MRLLRLAPLLLGIASVAEAGAAPESLALLPLENLSASPAAGHEVGSLIAAGIAKRGWNVVAGDAVDGVLDEARIRYVDSLTSGAGSKLCSSLNVSTLMLGTVYAFDATADPRIAVGVRLLSPEGKTLFYNLVALRTEDAEPIFQFGKPRTLEELVPIAVERLLKGLPAPGAAPAALRDRGVPIHLSAPKTYRSATLASGSRYRIAVLPFANAGPHEAARIVPELLVRRFTDSKLFDVVEPADLRAAIVAEKVRDLSDPDELRRLGKRLGATLFLTGTIYEFREAYQASADTPHLELETTVTDSETGEIVWTSYVARLGSDYQGLLQLGAINSVVALADQAASEIIITAEKTNPEKRMGLTRSASTHTEKEKSK